jgi:hypothetical protein
MAGLAPPPRMAGLGRLEGVQVNLTGERHSAQAEE